MYFDVVINSICYLKLVVFPMWDLLSCWEKSYFKAKNLKHSNRKLYNKILNINKIKKKNQFKPTYIAYSHIQVILPSHLLLYNPTLVYKTTHTFQVIFFMNKLKTKSQKQRNPIPNLSSLQRRSPPTNTKYYQILNLKR